MKNLIKAIAAFSMIFSSAAVASTGIFVQKVGSPFTVTFTKAGTLADANGTCSWNHSITPTLTWNPGTSRFQIDTTYDVTLSPTAIGALVFSSSGVVTKKKYGISEPAFTATNITLNIQIGTGSDAWTQVQDTGTMASLSTMTAPGSTPVFTDQTMTISEFTIRPPVSGNFTYDDTAQYTIDLEGHCYAVQ